MTQTRQSFMGNHQKPCKINCFLHFPLYCKSMHGCRSPGRASRDLLSRKSMREESLENQREMKVPLLRRHAIPGRARRHIGGARIPERFYRESSENLVKTNVSSKNRFAANPTRPNRGSVSPLHRIFRGLRDCFAPAWHGMVNGT